MMKKMKWVSNTLALNLRHLRNESGLSQKELAKKFGLSHRAIQDLEASKGNPTLETLHILAAGFKVPIPSLLALDKLRLVEGDSHFLDRYKKIFNTADIAVAVRNLDGVVIWRNKKVDRVAQWKPSETTPLDLLDHHSPISPETRQILKQQLIAERHGVSLPYTVTILGARGRECTLLRCYPTIVLPYKGNSPYFTSVYLTPVSDDCTWNYYEYCNRLLEAREP